MSIARRDFLIAGAALAGSAVTLIGHADEPQGPGPAHTRADMDALGRQLLAGNITCVRTSEATRALSITPTRSFAATSPKAGPACR